MAYDLSIVIPARNEMFVSNTIEDIVRRSMNRTEVMVVLDGEWASPPIQDHPRVTVIKVGASIGQRAATNLAVRLSRAKYIAKVDAHCAFDQDFDEKMIQDMKDDWTMVPVMRNLHAFDWVCDKGHRRYQGQSGPCAECGGETHREIVWTGKTNPQSTSYCFDPEPHFQYFKDFKARVKDDITPTMSLQGSFFMCTREKYWALNLCDEEFGSWGSQGIEVALKTWLSGGQVMVNHKTWYAHMFRTKGGDFGFPWPASGRQIQAAKRHAREVFFKKQWPLQKHPVSWLVEKFWPIPCWTEEDLNNLKEMEGTALPKQPVSTNAEKAQVSEKTKGIVYYTDNRLDAQLMQTAQKLLLATGLPIVSVSLKPLDFGHNIVLGLERSYVTMFKQILTGLETIDTEFVFLCEHDVLYSNEHFLFTPPSNTLWYYNKNNWQCRQSDGHAVFWDCKKVSQVVANREFMIEHYKKRIKLCEDVGFSRRMGFEPGTHGRPERVDDTKSEFFETKIPNLDIRHRYNLTASRWSPDLFRNKPKNWTESHVNKLPGWENLKL